MFTDLLDVIDSLGDTLLQRIPAGVDDGVLNVH